ncbi:ribbon-helix-helix domain-containing protein [Methylobacterium sp. C25]|nr:ribbon-helix-helix domain-containing protein [Methylobacterium sp. C25]
MSATTITLTPEISEAIDRFIAGQEPKPSRDEAVNAALGDWLSH